MAQQESICVIGQFPPPIHGLSMALQCLIESDLRDKYNFEIVDIKNNKKFINNLIRIATCRSNAYYLTIAQSKLGNIRDLVILSLIHLKKKPCIVHLHGGYYGVLQQTLSSIQRKCNQVIMGKVDIGIVLSHSLKSMFMNVIHDSKIRVVFNAVEESSMMADEELQEKMNQVCEGPLKLLYLSNFIPSKGYLDFIEAIKFVKDAGNTNFRAYFAGVFFEEATKNDFFETLKQYELENYVLYLGVVNGKEKADILKEAHVFVLPTYYEKEGQPISIIEAMANGMTVISTNHAAIPDMIQDNVNGFIVNKKQPKEIADKIEMIMNNRRILQKIALVNRKEVKDNYMIQRYISNLESVFEEVLK